METSKELKQIISLPANRMDIALYAERINDALENGEINPFDVLRAFKGIEKLYEAVKPVLDPLVLIEADKYNEATIDLRGCKFTKKNGPSTYDYSNCNDSEYKILLEYKNEYEKKLKERMTFLQSLPGMIELVSEDTGDIQKIYPPARSQKSIVTTSFV